jgi:hypothetical protein
MTRGLQVFLRTPEAAGLARPLRIRSNAGRAGKRPQGAVGMAMESNTAGSRKAKRGTEGEGSRAVAAPAVSFAAWLALAGIVVLAAGLRFSGLNHVPEGLFRDEAEKGYNAWAIATQGGCGGVFGRSGRAGDHGLEVVAVCDRRDGGEDVCAVSVCEGSVSLRRDAACRWGRRGCLRRLPATMTVALDGVVLLLRRREGLARRG